jgi:NAD-dependent deacetylase
MKKLVIFSGSGLDEESGIPTFRSGSDGLWENYNVMDVASIDGWRRNRKLILEFYNKFRKKLSNIKPNSAHIEIAKLEDKFDVYNITQNISSLLEMAGSTNVIHLHGKLNEMKSCISQKIYDWPENFEIKTNSTDEEGEQLRPNIVWFGEAVPNMEKAIEIVKEADIFVVIGSSLKVYPAANLLSYVKENVPIYIIDPNNIDTTEISYKDNEVTFIEKTATEGITELIKYLK